MAEDLLAWQKRKHLTTQEKTVAISITSLSEAIYRRQVFRNIPIQSRPVSRRLFSNHKRRGSKKDFEKIVV
jgi:hypothetical protein